MKNASFSDLLYDSETYSSGFYMIESYFELKFCYVHSDMRWWDFLLKEVVLSHCDSDHGYTVDDDTDISVLIF